MYTEAEMNGGHTAAKRTIRWLLEGRPSVMDEPILASSIPTHEHKHRCSWVVDSDAGQQETSEDRALAVGPIPTQDNDTGASIFKFLTKNIRYSPAFMVGAFMGITN